MNEALSLIVRDSRVIVCCGAGGVGKTTTSGALAVAGARMGRKVLVLTIDPSKRLAEALGVERNPPSPIALARDRLEAIGVRGSGSLDAWMLDPKRVADDAVRRIVMDPVEVDKLLHNRIYQHVTGMVAGVHEYTAMQALHRFVAEGRYDLVVLDTPPSRHALDFLEAPSRLSRFLDGRIFKMFLPSSAPRGIGSIKRVAGGFVSKVLGTVLGEQLSADLSVFFGVFAHVLAAITRDVTTMRGFLGGPDVAFLLITSPATAAIEEALFFQRKTESIGLPFRGFVLNRSRAGEGERLRAQAPPVDASPELRSALEKLNRLADAELELGAHDRELLADLKRRAGTGRFALALPFMRPAKDELSNLSRLADLLI